jgi:hypothetical protein
VPNDKEVTALAIKPAEPVELTKKDIEAGERRYREEILDPCLSKRAAARGAILKAYWELGAYAAKLLEEPRRYGKATMQRFAEDMSDEHHKISANLVYKWVQFHRTYSQDQLEAAQRKALSWSDVEELVDVKDLAKREELETKVSEGKLDYDGLRDAKKKLNKEAKKKGKGETRGGLHAPAAFKNLSLFCGDFERRLDDYKEALKKHDKMEEGEKKSKIDIARKDARKTLAVLSAKIAKALDLDA